MLCELNRTGYDGLEAFPALLAEQIEISRPIVEETFRVANENLGSLRHFFSAIHSPDMQFDWNELQQEYPNITGTEVEWKQRLFNALQPLLSELTAS